MHFGRLLVATSFALSGAAFPGVLSNTAPTLIGPIYVPPSDSLSPELLAASSDALSAITEAIRTGVSEYGAIDNQMTSFSATVFSATTNATLFTYHFEAPQLNGSYTKGKLGDGTIYRSGSMGKLLTMYLFLVDIGDGVFLDSVTKYIPELKEAYESLPKDPIRYVDWDEVTVGSLATQLSGIGRNFLLGDFATDGFQSLPLPSFEDDGYLYESAADLPNCTFYGSNLPTCTRAQFFQGLVQHPPGFLSYTAPMYSNLNFALLGLVYESITGHSMESGWNDVYHTKLGMTSTTYKYPGAQADAIIPYNDTWAIFSYDIGLITAAGGEYTCIEDLRTWGNAILQSSLLPKVLTRRWFTHAASTAVWTSNVGTPFEIYRLPIIADFVYNLTRIVDIYAKSGDVGQYSTFIGLVPDHEIGIAVLAAGVTPNTQVTAIRDILLDNFVNGAEAAAKVQAKSSFTGKFKASDRNSSITLGVDGGPGVYIGGWISNGTDFLNNNIALPTVNLRIYPTSLVRKDGDITYRSYRILFASGREPTVEGRFPEANDYWLSVDGAIYNNRAVDNFIVGFDSSGIVQNVYCDGLQVNMTRSVV